MAVCQQFDLSSPGLFYNYNTATITNIAQNANAVKTTPPQNFKIFMISF